MKKKSEPKSKLRKFLELNGAGGAKDDKGGYGIGVAYSGTDSAQLKLIPTTRRDLAKPRP